MRIPPVLQAPLAGCLLMAMLSLSAFAESASLTWETRTLEAATNNGVGELALEYHFENKGTQPVQIRGIKTGCDCTVAEPDRHSIAPGERGTLRVRFKIGFRTGRQERSLLVDTNDAPNSPTELHLNIDILELLPLKPRLLFWERTEEAKEKAILIVPALPEKTRITAVECSEKDFSVRLEASAEKGGSLLWVKPAGTNGYSQTRIVIHYTHEGKELEAHAFAAVR